MNRNKTTIIGVAAVVLGKAVGLPYLFDARKKQPDDSFLAEALLSRMEADTTIQAASVSVVRTGSGNEPVCALLSRSDYRDGEIVDEKYAIGKAAVVPGTMMMAPTLTYLLEGGFMEPAWLAEKDPGTFRDLTGYLRYVKWYHYLDEINAFFGSSYAYWLPKVWDHGLLRDDFESIVYGQGIHLSQEQVLTFYDALANGGVRPRHRYIGKRRILSKWTAEDTVTAMKDYLRRNVTDGTGAILADHPARIAGLAGAGTLRHGFVPGLKRQADTADVRTVSFAGFFPVESPRYTMCVTFYFKPGVDPGETILPQEVFGELATQLTDKAL